MNSCKKHMVIAFLSLAKGCFFFAKSEGCLQEEEVRCGVLSLANLYPRYFEVRISFYLNRQYGLKLLGRQDAKILHS